MEEGVKIYPNPIGVLTNNPPFPFHLDYIRNFLHLSPETPENQFAKRLESAGFQGKWGLTPYGEGMGAIGLPGDVSPASRFVRASFLKWNSVCGEDAGGGNLSVFSYPGRCQYGAGIRTDGGGKI